VEMRRIKLNEHVYEKLQYNKLKELVKEYCVSSLGKTLIDRLVPTGNIKAVENRLNETTEARRLLDFSGNVQLGGIVNIKEIIEKVQKDIILDPEHLTNVASFLRGCSKIKLYMKDKEFYAPTLYNYSLNIVELKHIEEEIESSIRNNKIEDDATTELKKIRKQLAQVESKISEGLNSFLKNPNNKNYIQDFFITRRQGRLTIPIKASYKNMVSGVVIESSGKTAFMEPDSISKFTTKYNELKSEEAIEEYKILSYLTTCIYDNLYTIERNIEVMSHYDMVFAKGKYSKAIAGISPDLNEHGYIRIINGKHPLLEGTIVPLNIVIGENFRSLIITGPNAGGKTIVLKTVGLLTLAMQSGFHIPVSEGSNMSVFDKVFADIGDDQSIENSLSTFSAHVKNLSQIIRQTNKSTLLLFDEIGSGTEPNEGAALAIAILEDVYNKGAITVATTHYNEIKNFSSNHPDFENAAMKFDKDTLEPLYQLVVGKSGDSNALWISRKMGIYEDVLNKAEKYMKEKSYNFNKIDKSKTRFKKEIVVEDSKYNYCTGDKVYIRDINDSAIVYKEKDEYNNIIVLHDKTFKTFNEKQLKLEFTAEELYPAGYDLNTLFIGYRERKVEKDIKRGSKKTLKKIKKYGIDKVINDRNLK